MTFRVLAGDFKEGKESYYKNETFHMSDGTPFTREKISIDQIKEIDIANEESVKRLGGTVGWGIAGAAILGPVGLLAGLLAGGKGKDTTFVCAFKDGRKFMASMNSKTYSKLQADLFKKQSVA